MKKYPDKMIKASKGYLSKNQVKIQYISALKAPHFGGISLFLEPHFSGKRLLTL